MKDLQPTQKQNDDAAAEKKRADEKKAEEARKAAANGDGDMNLSDVVKQLSTISDELKKSNTKNEELGKKIEKQERDTRHRDILKWLRTDCPYLSVDIQKTANEIMTIQDTSETAGELMKESLKRTSAALENSDAFDEVGSGRDGQIGPSTPGSELIMEVKKELAEVKKSGDSKISEAEIVRSIVSGKCRNVYLAYRDAQIQRAKLSGIDPSLLSQS